MLKEKTVFVVGAGASYDLGLPLGSDLKEIIADLCRGKPRGTRYERVDTKPQIADLVLGNEWPNFDLASRMLADNLPRAASIDNFLDNHRHNKQLVDLGKRAIAYVIANCEANTRLVDGQLSDFSRVSKQGKQIHTTYFLEKFLPLLVRGHTSQNIHKSLKNLTFIIFNYDRCLEHFLVLWLNRNFGQDLTELILENVRFVHVYGNLGEYTDTESFPAIKLPHRASEIDMFDNRSTLVTLATQIQIFTEVSGAEKQSEIEELLDPISNIVFVGFAFEEQNMKMLENSQFDRVFATSFGFSEADQKEIAADLQTMFAPRFSSCEVASVTGANIFYEFSRKIKRDLGTL